MASVNSGVAGVNADSCAGCHRAHTANGPMLLQAASEEELCLSLGGAASTGATTDVETGVQYVPAVDDPATAANEAGTRSGTQLGALRGGGFEEARIGDPFRYTVASGTSSARLGKVRGPVYAEAVTSAHMPDLAGLTQPGVAWGNGHATSVAGQPNTDPEPARRPPSVRLLPQPAR